MSRPVSVTVVCWIIIVLAAEAIAGSLSGLVQSAMAQVIDGPVSISMAVKIGIILQVAFIVLALFMLYRANWARIAYVCFALFMILSLVVQSLRHTAMLPIALFVVARTTVIIYFLFQSKANKYYSNGDEAETALS